jgi:hypothetical protein
MFSQKNGFADVYPNQNEELNINPGLALMHFRTTGSGLVVKHLHDKCNYT